jgi:hypothetical protein
MLFEKFGITAESRFLRFGETPEALSNSLRAWKAVFTMRRERQEGEFYFTIRLYLKDGQLVPRCLKLIRKHWIRVKGRYIKKKSIEAEEYFRRFQALALRDLQCQFDSLKLDRPKSIERLLDPANNTTTNSDAGNSKSKPKGPIYRPKQQQSPPVGKK